MSRQAQSDALFTDLYQLTMAQAYHQSGQSGHATFSLYFRNFPPNRVFYVFCGLESAIRYLESLSFTEDDVAALERIGTFDAGFLDHLRTVRFTGGVRAMAEGEVFFPNEPVMEVSGPIIGCQLVETILVNQISLESMLATKAARVVAAAQGRQVIDFGARRAHGTDAAIKLARASYIAGFDGTSNVAAAVRYGIPAVGTMAHSFISSFGTEREAFQAYAESFPDSSTFLVDTYDTLDGVRNAIDVAQDMKQRGGALRAIRLDSGDIGPLARQARRMLDGAGLDTVQVLASGGLDEYAIDNLVRSGAPIDGFGVGTRVGTSADAPYTDFVYKLVEYEGKPLMKLSSDKATVPGPKQVYRASSADGRIERDVIGRLNELDQSDDYRPLLGPVMANGEAVTGLPGIEEVREFHCRQIAVLPPGLLGVRPTGSYRVDISDQLGRLTEQVRGQIQSESDKHTEQT